VRFPKQIAIMGVGRSRGPPTPEEEEVREIIERIGAPIPIPSCGRGPMPP
jgi:hypothetical protein